MARKTRFFLPIVEAPPIFGETKVVQGERRTKQKILFFVFYPEAQPIFGETKVVQAEHNGKKNTIFSCPLLRRRLSSAQPKWCKASEMPRIFFGIGAACCDIDGVFLSTVFFS
ncbi:MAG: hypothetical protein IJS04_08185 [Muribaculaceae bacterium]|nr:hypothetical protein [Muribaculaceae bacterium]MBQ7205801.1 hypothetical protein [Muribaculaceae bacterium]